MQGAASTTTKFATTLPSVNSFIVRVTRMLPRMRRKVPRLIFSKKSSLLASVAIARAAFSVSRTSADPEQSDKVAGTNNLPSLPAQIFASSVSVMSTVTPSSAKAFSSKFTRSSVESKSAWTQITRNGHFATSLSTAVVALLVISCSARLSTIFRSSFTRGCAGVSYS